MPPPQGPPPRVTDHRGLPRAAVLVALSVIVALALSSDTVHAHLLRLLERAAVVIEARPLAGPVVFVLLAAASAMIAFVSSTVLVPAALLAWGRNRTFLLLWGGWVLGAVLAYTVARRFGRPLIARLVSRDALARYERRIPRQAPVSLILLFQLAVPSEIVGYVLGTVRYPFGRYLLVAMLAELPYAVGTIYLGASVLQRRLVLLIAIGLAGAVTGVVAVRFLARRLRGAESGPPVVTR